MQSGALHLRFDALAGGTACRGFGAIFGWFLPALQLPGVSLGCAHGTVSRFETTESGQRWEESGQEMKRSQSRGSRL